MPGCVCDAGFVRNSEGVCVAPQQCPNRELLKKKFDSFSFLNKITAKCSENEEFQQFGPGCEPSCQNPGEMLCKAPSHPGCFCKENYVRNENNKCVLREECPKGLPPEFINVFAIPNFVQVELNVRAQTKFSMNVAQLAVI